MKLEISKNPSNVARSSSITELVLEILENSDINGVEVKKIHHKDSASGFERNSGRPGSRNVSNTEINFELQFPLLLRKTIQSGRMTTTIF